MRPDAQMRRVAAGALVAAFGSVPLAQAQLPNLSQITGATTSAATTGGTQTTGGTNTNTGKTTGTQTNAETTGTATTGATSGGSTGTSSGTGSSSTLPAGVTATSTGTSSFPSNPLSTSTSGSAFGRLSGAPTIAGVGIPTMIVPYTANAPYMKKSSLPEGTVFIAVGAVLAFLGFCVIAWRALVAWSINRSVKRAALASIMASETKNPGGWASNPFKPAGGFYSQAPGGSTLSLGDHAGIREKSSRRGGELRNPIPSTGSGLFFSPTASNVSGATANIPMQGLVSPGNRSSSFLPAGYYASPSSTPGSGNPTTTIGGGAPPFASPTAASGGGSPGLQPRRMSRPLSNMQLAPASRDGNRLSTGRPVSGLNPQASASSLQVGTGHIDEGLPGSRAPSAYLEDLFEGHGQPGVGGQPGGQYR